MSQNLDALSSAIEKEIQRVKKEISHSDVQDPEDFDLRGGLYELAFQVAPQARNQDIVFLMKWIRPALGEVSADIAAGTGFISRPLADRTKSMVYAIDSSRVQLQFLENHKAELLIKTVLGSPSSKQTWKQIPKNSLDIVTSYGGIHHIVDEEGHDRQQETFDNVSRHLKPGGRFVAGDVGSGTALAVHFEKSVKSHCLTGHHERWLSESRLRELCIGASLKLERVEVVNVEWIFESQDQLALFMKAIHAYNMEPQDILSDLNKTLGYQSVGSHVHLNWPMLFFEIKKSQTPTL